MNGTTISLSDGRALGFQSLGDAKGRPVFWFHGTPGSRLVLAADDALARIPGIRLILPDRPGYGLSDPKPERRLMDWAGDVAELADRLDLQRFAVAGESGGGPHALACASALPDRVTMGLVLSSPSPAGFPGATRGMSLGNRLGILAGRYAPWLVRPLIRSQASAFLKDPSRYVAAIGRQMARPDQRLLEDENYRQAFVRDFREAYRQGSDGHVVDGALTLTSGDWGFRLSEISVPVHLWYGLDDKLVSFPMAEHLAAEIPNCTPHFIEDAGHLLADHPKVIAEIRRLLL